jgi:hypothetical protein
MDRLRVVVQKVDYLVSVLRRHPTAGCTLDERRERLGVRNRPRIPSGEHGASFFKKGIRFRVRFPIPFLEI